VTGAETPALEIDGLTTCFETQDGTAVVIDGMSYRVGRGETLGVVGESGCGKSITALSAMRLIRPPGRIVAGRVLLEGRDLLALSESDMQQVRGNALSMIFQDPMSSLNPVLSIGRQIAEVGMLHQHLSRRAALDRAAEMLRMVHIPDQRRRLDEYPHQLSGGMRQRVALARALAVHPEVLFMDEPFAALDTFARFRLQDELLRLWRELKQTVLFVTHDLDEAVYLASRIVLLAPNPGRVEQTLAVHLDRPCDRTGPVFTEYRRQVYQAFELVAQAASEYTI
jgi:peptide/nickel transport system ATP-binding protein